MLVASVAAILPRAQRPQGKGRTAERSQTTQA